MPKDMETLQKTFERDVFEQFRTVFIEDSQTPLTNEGLQKALTVNQILLEEYNMTLCPKDVITLAQSPSVDTLPKKMEALCVSRISAKPMYPDFPKQVMDISEAEYRFHQMVHYFSTYGMEILFGVEVSQGWLPKVEDTEKTERDERLLDARVISLHPASTQYLFPLRCILSKKERMNQKEKNIVFAVISLVGAGGVSNILLENSIQVSFKQNLMMLMNDVLNTLPEEQAVTVIRALCQHTGDVLKCIDYSLVHHHFHFTKPQKRVWVRVLESYPVNDFRANVILSNKKAQRVLLVLKYLDYKQFSKSKEHVKVVNDLRSGTLRSWQSQVVFLLKSSTSDSRATLQFIAQRPGILLRMVNELVKKGYPMEDIAALLMEKADMLSLPTLVQVMQTFYARKQKDIFQHLLPVLQQALSSKETPLKDKKVYLASDMFDWHLSRISSSEEGGYLHAGLVMKIPEEAARVRFFVYWNDNHRVDVDLHSYGYKVDGTMVHVGWNSQYKESGIVSSGDITHSNAAEYIDIDLDKTDLDCISNQIDVFTEERFKDIATCYAGLMLVKNIGEHVKLYDPANCILVHHLKSSATKMFYGCIYPKERLLLIEASSKTTMDDPCKIESGFSVWDYVDVLLKSQGAEVVEMPEEADVLLRLEKGTEENSISLLDEHYFLT